MWTLLTNSPFSTASGEFFWIDAKTLSLSTRDLHSTVNFNAPLVLAAKRSPGSWVHISVIAGHWCLPTGDRGIMHLTVSHTTLLLRYWLTWQESRPLCSLGTGWTQKSPAEFVIWVFTLNGSGFQILLHFQSMTTWGLCADGGRLLSCHYPVTCCFPYG